MKEDPKYAIGIALEANSRRYNGETEHWFHSYVTFGLQTRPKETRVLQQLHHNVFHKTAQGFGPIIPYVKPLPFKLTLLESETFTTYFVGREIDILPMWNHGLRDAIKLKARQEFMSEDYRHGEGANNCIKQCLDTLAAMGLGRDATLLIATAGTKAPARDIQIQDQFSYAQHPVIAPEQEAEILAQLWEENKILLAALQEPGSHEKLLPPMQQQKLPPDFF